MKRRDERALVVVLKKLSCKGEGRRKAFMEFCQYIVGTILKSTARAHCLDRDGGKLLPLTFPGGGADTVERDVKYKWGTSNAKQILSAQRVRLAPRAHAPLALTEDLCNAGLRSMPQLNL